MIIKRIFNPIKVILYVKSELVFAVAIAVTAFLLHEQNVTTITFPFSISAILGSALAIFIAFRNNSSYSRWWEARTLWGSIINSSRVLARLIITFTDSHAHQQNYEKARSEQFKKEMIYKVIAWAHVLRLHLRNQDYWQGLKAFLSEQEFENLIKSQNKLLRQYDFFTRVFLYAFMLLLPFSLIGDFTKMNIAYMMIPVSIIISFVFAIIGKVGEVNEDPFENRITDVPLTDMCNTIERDLREMLGETDLPIKLEAENGFLY